MIKVISSLQELETYRSVWENIYRQDPGATPFQKFDYIVESIRSFQNRDTPLYIILVNEVQSNQWVAAVPFFIAKQSTLQFINGLHTDFCEPIILPQFNNHNLFKELAAWIIADTKIGGLNLLNLKSDSAFIRSLKPFFKFSITYDLNYYSTIPVVKKETDRDCIDAFRYVQSTKRKNWRKTWKKLKSESIFEIRSKEAGLNYPKQDIQFLVDSMISKGLREEEYLSQDMLDFWESLYEKNVLSVAMLYDKDHYAKSCNFMYYDEKRNEYIQWITLYKDSSWNLSLYVMLTDYLYDNENGVINFARGIYDFKIANFHPDVKPLFCVRIAKTPWRHIRNMMSVAFHYSKPIIKTILRR